MDRAKGQGVGSGHRVLDTSGPEDEVPEAAARWRQAARAARGCEISGCELEVGLGFQGPPGLPRRQAQSAQEASSSSLRGVSLQCRSPAPVWAGLGGARLLEVQLRGHTAWSGRGLARRAQGRCLLPATRLGRWWQGEPQAVRSPRPNSASSAARTWAASWKGLHSR